MVWLPNEARVKTMDLRVNEQEKKRRNELVEMKFLKHT